MNATYKYDPVTQLNVLSDGTAVIDTVVMLGPTMTHKQDGGPARKDDE
jgi:putative ATP-grasp target RiPP